MQGERSKSQSMLELGEKAERSGDTGGALGWYDASARADSGFGSAYQKRCSLLRRLGRTTEALAAAAAYAASLPQAAAAHHEAGLCLLALHRTEEAETAFRRAVAIDPGLSAAWRNLGVALGKLGRTQEAFSCFDRAEGRDMALVATAPPPHRSPELAGAVHDLMAGLLETGGGFAQIDADGPFSFKASVALLGFLLRDYDMDGVVVAVARPSHIYRQTLARRVDTPHPPHYVEVAASPDGAAGPAFMAPQSMGREGGADSTGADVTTLSAFEPDRVAAAVKAALQKVAGRFGGEEHFVLMDDLAAMEFYNGTEVVKKFSSGFFAELSSLGIFSFVVLPSAQSQLLGSGAFATRKRLRVEGRWLSDV